jgi:hypothetical protein
VSGSWDQRIRRAEQLGAENGPAASLLGFYARLLGHQKAVYDAFESRRPADAIEAEVELILESGSGGPDR